MNIPLLHRLRASPDSFLPLAALGPDLERVRRDLDELAAFGFALEQHPYHGVAYRGPARRLCPDQIEWELETTRIGRRIAVWNRVTSTNDLATRAAGSTANDGLVVLAEEQTAGRGRRGRSWSAPPASSLLMSTLIFPPDLLANPGWLTALGAVAVAEVVEHWTGQRASIKWPNDVRISGRKVAGILVERGLGAVLGVGLNVNIEAEEFPEDLRASAASLQMFSGDPLDRSEVARCLIRCLDQHFLDGLRSGPGLLNDRWRSRLEPLGRLVRLKTHDGLVVGRLVDADLELGLTVVLENGRTRRVSHVEVTSFDGDSPDCGTTRVI